MKINLANRSFLTLLDYTPSEIEFLLSLAADLKKQKNSSPPPKTLAGKNVALLFEKPSTRTRCAFSVACADQGAHCDYLGANDIHLGLHETVEDTARVLGRMYDAIAFRGFAHSTAQKLAQYSQVPVWNALTDRFHPTQALADCMTIIEQKGKLQGVKLAYCGDGRNNVANSLMIAAAKMGIDLRIVTHKSLFPDNQFLAQTQKLAAETGAKITVTDVLDDAIKGADVIYNDVWASMGEEDQIAQRIELLAPYRVDRRLIEAAANPDVIYMHCLPCNHNNQTALAKQFPEICETTDEVFESEYSKVFDQAENRLHTIKALITATLPPR